MFFPVNAALFQDLFGKVIGDVTFLDGHQMTKGLDGNVARGCVTEALQLGG